MTKNVQNLTFVVKNVFLFMLTVDERKLLNICQILMTISVQGIDLIVPKESGIIANLGEQMLMKKSYYY